MFATKIKSLKIGEKLKPESVNIDLEIAFCSGTFGDISTSLGKLWRFAPMADPLVEEWHSRYKCQYMSMIF
jgi:hypothetical protein